MSTTRHLVNRQRRLATVAAERATATAPPHEPTAPDPSSEAPGKTPAAERTPTDDAATDDTGAPEPEKERRKEKEAEPRGRRTSRPLVRLPAVLCALTVLLGAFAAWAFSSAAGLRDDPARRNTALTDIGRTSEVKGQISEAVGAVFSYNYAAPGKSERAVRSYLVGKAVRQHADMLAQVRAEGQKQKLVLTTTVTDSGVELLDGDRARLLIFADQSNTRTGKSDETTYAAAMFAVDAVRRSDTWRISAIDTFTH
ncbi:hypothetical protein ACF1BU_26260 [Streptomyces sp. NPDC014724]|uniref:hypothetical protein n=1 Tax=unclassified Streptomyces TaxID=2593676 RepID=UPI0036F750D7